VQQPEREGVLAFEVRPDADLPQRVPRDHRVLVVTQRRLDLFHLLTEPLGVLAEHRGDGLSRVPGPLGCPPGRVQGHVGGLTGMGLGRPPEPLVGAPVGAGDRGPQRLLGRLVRVRAQRRLGQDVVQLVQQREVPLGVQRGQHGLAGLRGPRGEVLAHPGRDRAHDQLHRDLVHVGLDVLGQHLVVPVVAQHVTEPAQLSGQVLGVGAVQDPAERLQRAAEPAGGDPHLVHRVRLVPPDRRVQ
jgi:hypothetical protein